MPVSTYPKMTVDSSNHLLKKAIMGLLPPQRLLALCHCVVTVAAVSSETRVDMCLVDNSSYVLLTLRRVVSSREFRNVTLGNIQDDPAVEFFNLFPN